MIKRCEGLVNIFLAMTDVKKDGKKVYIRLNSDRIMSVRVRICL